MVHGDLHGQRLTVFFSTQDCALCHSALGQLNGISKLLPVEVVCDKAKRDFIPALLKQHYLETSPSLRITYIDGRKFRKQVKDRSICEFQASTNDAPIRFLLKDLSRYTAHMGALVSTLKEQRSIKLDQPATLSDRSDIYLNGTMLWVVDHTLRQTFRIHLNGNEGVVQEFRPTEAFRRGYLSFIGIDKERDDSLKEMIVSDGQYWPTAHSISFRGDTANVMYGLRFPDVKGTSIIYRGHPFLAAVVGDSIVAFREWAYSFEGYGDQYVVSNYASFCSKSLLFLPAVLMATQDSGTVHMLTRYRVGDRSVAFEDFVDVPIPDALASSFGETPHHYPGMRGPLFWVCRFPFLYDISAGHAIDLSTKLDPNISSERYFAGRPKFWLIDAITLPGDFVLLLYMLNDQHWVGWFDLVEGQFVARKRINDRAFRSGLIQLDPNGGIIGLASDLRSVVLIR